mmetsp:Transcript_9113/g.31078  ORF Transcript_9113/g.31078 Transcript_9113/m.31078 type:complete len:237 (+) Transcript_9113:492-1202(+)
MSRAKPAALSCCRRQLHNVCCRFAAGRGLGWHELDADQLGALAARYGVLHQHPDLGEEERDHLGEVEEGHHHDAHEVRAAVVREEEEQGKRQRGDLQPGHEHGQDVLVLLEGVGCVADLVRQVHGADGEHEVDSQEGEEELLEVRGHAAPNALLVLVTRVPVDDLPLKAKRVRELPREQHTQLDGNHRAKHGEHVYDAHDTRLTAELAVEEDVDALDLGKKATERQREAKVERVGK